MLTEKAITLEIRFNIPYWEILWISDSEENENAAINLLGNFIEEKSDFRSEFSYIGAIE